MQFRFLPAFVVFVGSYLPLSLILLAQNFDYSAISQSRCWPIENNCILPIRSPIFSIGLLLFTLLCFALTLIFLRLVRPSHDIEVATVEHIPTDLMNYTLPYVVSFMSIDYQDTGKFIGFLVFLAWMFWITFKAGRIILNPVLIAFGWRLYNVTFTSVGDEKVLSSNALVHGILEAGTQKKYPLQDILIVKPERGD
jgi:hypothetical protein